MISRIRSWWRAFLTRLRVRKLVAAAMRESWSKVRCKTAGLSTLKISEYVGKHSSTVVHRQVEALVRQDPTIDAVAANSLIVKASDRLNRQLLRKLGSRSRIARRAA